ncbi:MAG TPA: cyclic nucleotide-binding domain-containing protein [Candidatus Sulfotelmatobacter sp.]|nr:cyclic nucleotide-binding domain-containing protein [Candidatus Sulfotelmatobacter sp.]
MPRKRLSPEVRKKLEVVAIPMRKERGTILFREGTPCPGAYLIRRGKVRLTLDAASRVYPARILGSGFLIGLPATLSGGPYSLTAQVKETCRVDFIPRAKLLKLVRGNPRVGIQILRTLSDEIFLMRNVAKRRLEAASSLHVH